MSLDSYISSATVTHVRSSQIMLQTKMMDKTDKNNQNKTTDGDMTKTAP